MIDEHSTTFSAMYKKKIIILNQNIFVHEHFLFMLGRGMKKSIKSQQ